MPKGLFVIYHDLSLLESIIGLIINESTLACCLHSPLSHLSMSFLLLLCFSESYSECYPGYQEYNREIVDSDDEDDLSKMDMGGRVSNIWFTCNEIVCISFYLVSSVVLYNMS